MPDRSTQELERRLAGTTDPFLRDRIATELQSRYETEPAFSRPQMDEFAMIGEQRMFGGVR